MPEGDYDVCIDSSLEPGHLTYGELLRARRIERRIPHLGHICHPSLCNDNLSGVSIAAHLARHLLDQTQRRRSYRFLFIPGTIGAIAWLAQNVDRLDRVRGGLTLVCLGDASHLTYKRSFVGASELDRADLARADSFGRSVGGHRLLPLRLRRASIQLPWFSPARRFAHADAMANFPSITPRPTISNSSIPISLQSRFMRFAA